MKVLTKIFIFPLFIGLTLFGMILYSLLTLSPNNDDCMVQYVKKYYPNGVTYIIGTQHHIDKEISGLERFRVGTANGCFIKDDNIVSSFFNSFYCIETKLFVDLKLDKYIFYKMKKT